MIKARHHILHPTSEQCDLLKQVQQEAAACWNAVVAEAKAHYDAGGGWISKNDLQKRLKGRFALHSQTVQGLVDRFCGNRQTAAENRRMGLDTNYPWREKRFVTVPFKQMAIRCSTGGTVQLSLRAGARFDTGVPFSDGIHTCEIMWRNGRYVLSCTAEYQPAEPVEQGLRAGIDIGEIHPVAVCAENGAGRWFPEDKSGRSSSSATRALGLSPKGCRAARGAAVAGRSCGEPRRVCGRRLTARCAICCIRQRARQSIGARSKAFQSW